MSVHPFFHRSILRLVVKYGKYIGEVKAEFKVQLSEMNTDQYNLEMNFTNGIQFFYTDGKASALLDGEVLDIDGKYVIESKLGTAKISFDPKSGKAYYFFEPASANAK